MSEDTQRYSRRIIRIQATDSPNVRLALAEQSRGLPVSNRTLIRGILSWNDYLHRLNTWDEVRICVGLRAMFWEGADALLYPPEWIDRANRIAISLRGKRRDAKSMGVDSGEGVANSAWSVVDEFGLMRLHSQRTKDTTEIPEITLQLMRQYNLPPEMIVFDIGGGGKQHADYLRKKGYNVRTVGFGEKVSLPLKRGTTRMEDKRKVREERAAYLNRRAEMYGALRELINPARGMVPHNGWVRKNMGEDVFRDTGIGFGIPPEYIELRKQMGPIPLKRDSEDRLYILPKNKRKENSKEQTLTQLIGHSPDELDSLVVAIWGMQNKPIVSRAGVM